MMSNMQYHISYATRIWMGKTIVFSAASTSKGKHPHVCGEDALTAAKSAAETETPPRAWGRFGRFASDAKKGRNTPRAWGKTKFQGWAGTASWKHLHVRGEDVLTKVESVNSEETPPRAWGRLLVQLYRSYI